MSYTREEKHDRFTQYARDMIPMSHETTHMFDNEDVQDMLIEMSNRFDTEETK